MIDYNLSLIATLILFAMTTPLAALGLMLWVDNETSMGAEMSRGRTGKFTSKMKAVIDPGRYGLTVIDSVFGVYRPRISQELLLEGELVKDRKGRVHRFAYKEGDVIFVTPA